MISDRKDVPQPGEEAMLWPVLPSRPNCPEHMYATDRRWLDLDSHLRVVGLTNTCTLFSRQMDAGYSP